MKQLERILIPTDLSEYSRRALVYGCWLAIKEKASSLIILHVANELHAWEFYSDELSFVQVDRNWPIDRVLAEASLDLSRFLEPSMASLENVQEQVNASSWDRLRSKSLQWREKKKQIS